MDNFDSINSPPVTKVNSGPSSNLDLLDLLGKIFGRISIDWVNFLNFEPK